MDLEPKGISLFIFIEKMAVSGFMYSRCFVVMLVSSVEPDKNSNIVSFGRTSAFIVKFPEYPGSNLSGSVDTILVGWTGLSVSRPTLAEPVVITKSKYIFRIAESLSPVVFRPHFVDCFPFVGPV